MRRIVITGGHLTPALAVIDELVKRGGWEILFIGRKYAMEGDKTPSIEAGIIPKRGIWFVAINAGRVQRYFTRYTILALLKIPLGFFQAFYHLARFKPVVILSFGGYVSVPVVLAGWLLRIPAITHEQTVVRGLATRVNTLFAKKIAVSWSQTLNQLPAKKTVLTGNPIRQEIFRVNEKLWRILKFEKDLPLILVTGGNQGSHLINQEVKGALPELVKRYNIFHQCGHIAIFGDYEQLLEVRKKLSPILKGRYHFKKYVAGEEWSTLLRKADLVISRAGANITTELAALGKPAVLIPLPWLYQDEQTKNAQMLVEVGMAEILPQKELSAKTLSRSIDKMIANLDKYKKNAAKAKKLVKLDAAKRIVDLVEKL